MCTSLPHPQLVSQALRFISTAIRSWYYELLFSSRGVISSLVQGVVVPNVALPLEFNCLDLALPSGRGVGGLGGEASTRRQTAADVLQALVWSGYRTQTTEIVGTWIQTGLEAYGRDAEAIFGGQGFGRVFVGCHRDRGVDLAGQSLLVAIGG